MISLHRRASRGSHTPLHNRITNQYLLIRFQEMLKHSPSRNQRPKLVKVKVNLVFRMFLVIVIGVWMIYQLRLFLSPKLLRASENGGLGKDEGGAQQMKLGLGRRGLVMADDEKIGTGVKTKEEGKSEDKEVEVEVGVEDEDETEQLDEEEGLEIMEPLDDPLEENDLQNDDDQNVNRIEMKARDDDDEDEDEDDSSRRMKKDAIND